VPVGRTLKEHGLKAAMQLYKQLKVDEAYNADIRQFFHVTYVLLEEVRPGDGINVGMLLIQGDPSDIEAYWILARFYCMSVDTRTALNTIKKVLEIELDNAELQRNPNILKKFWRRRNKGLIRRYRRFILSFI